MEKKPYGPDAADMHPPVLPDHLVQAIISTDSDLKIKSWNKAAEALYGLNRQQVLNRLLPAAVCFAVVNDSFAGLISELERSIAWTGEMLYLHKDGFLKCIHATVNTVRDDSGDVAGYVMVSQDAHQCAGYSAGLRGVFDDVFQCVGLVNDQAAFPWSVVLHWRNI